MQVKLIANGTLEPVVAAYRKCHRSEERSDSAWVTKNTEVTDKGECFPTSSYVLGEKDKALINRLVIEMEPKHDSPLEHVQYTWDISGVSRSLTHQLVRHRIASYSQESQRYVKQNQFDYVMPPVLRVNQEAFEVYDTFMENAQRAYDRLVELGLNKEDARFVLPNACCTSIVVSMNARGLRNFLKLRTDKHAQWEIRALANLMYDSLPAQHKFMFEDVVQK